MSEKRKIFVSYSRADKDKVLPLVKNLEKKVGTRFWIDLDGIESTAQFEDVIVRAIMQCDILLFMLSDNSTNGKWTQREVFFAEKLGKRIVPIIIDGGESKGWAAFHFANINYIDAKNKYQLEKLVREINVWIESGSTTAPTHQESNTSLKQRASIAGKVLSRFIPLAKILLYAIILLIVVLFIIKFNWGGKVEKNEEELSKEVQVEEVELTPYGRINGHDYVELGLSVKWATCNVGASNPEEYGSYFAWGETSTKSEYTEGNSKTYNKSMDDIKGNSTYDAARANWGGSWRLPTKAECQELLDNCKSEWTTICGVKGRKFTSKINGKSIFLPAAGWLDGSSLNDVGQRGFYWSSSPPRADYACVLNFLSVYCRTLWNYRYYGYSVRAVAE